MDSTRDPLAEGILARLGPRLDAGLLLPGAVQAAPALLGAILARVPPEGPPMAGRVVETEAYNQDDPASHSFRGPGARTRSMFGRPGVAYVYRIYGVHHCLNVSAGEDGRGEAVLIRALAPLEGLDAMAAARAGRSKGLCDGPGKLCQALGVDLALDGEDLLASGRLFLLAPPRRIAPEEIGVSGRIGISKAVERPWRFFLRGDPHVSKGRPGPPPPRRRAGKPPPPG
jgi:DNA-3-methyladenine glycosylase